mgnify:CR=1 FL=1
MYKFNKTLRKLRRDWARINHLLGILNNEPCRSQRDPSSKNLEFRHMEQIAKTSQGSSSCYLQEILRHLDIIRMLLTHKTISVQILTSSSCPKRQIAWTVSQPTSPLLKNQLSIKCLFVICLCSNRLAMLSTQTAYHVFRPHHFLLSFQLIHNRGKCWRRWS